MVTGAPNARRRRASPYKLVAPRVPEHKHQRTICAMLRLELAREGHVSPHGVCWFSVDHANYGGVAATRVDRGIIAGLPDLWVLHLGRAVGIELKADDGSLSDAQVQFACSMLTCSSGYAVARDCADVLAVLDQWRIPRARRTHIAPRPDPRFDARGAA